MSVMETLAIMHALVLTYQTEPSLQLATQSTIWALGTGRFGREQPHPNFEGSATAFYCHILFSILTADIVVSKYPVYFRDHSDVFN
jgi:hypothetical protein